MGRTVTFDEFTGAQGPSSRTGRTVTADEFRGAPADAPQPGFDLVDFLKETAVEAAPSTIGGFLGARLGMLGGPFAPVTVPAGEAIGSGLGEIVNQLRRQSQGEDFSWAQVGAATAGGPILRTLGRLGRAGARGFARLLPGSTEVVQKEFIQPRVAAKVAQLRPPVPSETIFQRAAPFSKARVPATETVPTIRRMRGQARMAPQVNQGEISRMTGALEEFADIIPGQAGTPPTIIPGKQIPTGVLDPYGKPVMRTVPTQVIPGQPFRLPRPGPFHNRPTLERFRAQQTEVFGPASRQETGPALGRAKQIYNAMIADLEASGIPHVRDAMRAFRRELGVEEVEGLIKTHTSPMNRVGLFGGINESGVREFERINGAQVAKQISRHREKFERYFSPSEVNELIKFFRKQTTGTGLLQNVGARFASVGIGAAVGGPFGAAVGTFAPEIVFSMTTSETGRAILKRLLREGPITGPRLARALHDAGVFGVQAARAGGVVAQDRVNAGAQPQAPGVPEARGPRRGRFQELDEFLNGQR